MGNDKDIEEYEREYLERVKKGEKLDSKELGKPFVLTPLHYAILGSIRNGVSKYRTLLQRLVKKSGPSIVDTYNDDKQRMKITKKLNDLEKRGFVNLGKHESWYTRNFNPTMNLTEKAKEEIEKKIDELQEEYDKLVLLYEKKDKQKLREGMESNRSFFPLMMMMGITNGMMMGHMLGMNHMMMSDFLAEIDYAYDAGYADGSGDFGAEGGDFGDAGGDGGGFMDGGFQPGF